MASLPIVFLPIACCQLPNFLTIVFGYYLVLPIFAALEKREGLVRNSW
jgi:hypothetical protein